MPKKPRPSLPPEAWAALDVVLDCVSQRERDMLRRRFEGWSRSEIGQEFGITGTRVGQIEARGIRKLRAMAARDRPSPEAAGWLRSLVGEPYESVQEPWRRAAAADWTWPVTPVAAPERRPRDSGDAYPFRLT